MVVWDHSLLHLTHYIWVETENLYNFILPPLQARLSAADRVSQKIVQTNFMSPHMIRGFLDATASLEMQLFVCPFIFRTKHSNYLAKFTIRVVHQVILLYPVYVNLALAVLNLRFV